MGIRLKRVYEPPDPGDGLRVLVDRLWPRGLSRDKARVDHWLKDIAPSDRLRRWFGHDPEKWPEFKKRYFRELAAKPGAVTSLSRLARKQRVTLLYGARERRSNNATALKEYLTAKARPRKKREKPLSRCA